MTVLFLPSKSLFLLFHFLPLWCRISNSMLNKRSDNGHPCLVTYLKGKIFSVQPLYTFPVGFWRMLFIGLRKLPLIPNMLRTSFFLSLTGVKFYQSLSIFHNDCKLFFSLLICLYGQECSAKLEWKMKFLTQKTIQRGTGCLMDQSSQLQVTGNVQTEVQSFNKYLGAYSALGADNSVMKRVPALPVATF